MLDQLFGSKTRTSVLAFLFHHARQDVYPQEVVTAMHTDAANTLREFQRLAKAGIVLRRALKGRQYYRVNTDSPHYNGLRLLFAQAQGKTTHAELKKFVERFAWIRYTFSGVPMTITDAQKTIRTLGKTEKDFRALLQERSLRAQNLHKEKQMLLRQYRLSRRDAALFAIGADIVFLKYFRKGIFAESYFSVEFLLAAIGRRIGCSGDEVAALLPHEVLAGLQVERVPRDLPRYRVRHSWLLSTDGQTYAVGKSLVDLIKSCIQEQKSAKGIQGQVAYSGKVQGTVKIVNAAADMKKMRTGNVLVSRSTNPSLLVAMNRASAFVTDLGGLTCHAAIVAREMKKPCIVGTKNATTLLKDGDLVEVDAEQGIVRKL